MDSFTFSTPEHRAAASDDGVCCEAEQALASKSELLSTVLESVGHGIVMFDSSRRLLVWNDRYQQVLQLPEGFLQVGLSNWKMALYLAKRGDYGEGDPEKLAAERLNLLWNGDDARSEITIRNENIYDVFFQRTNDGGLVITYTDITERKEAEEALLESEARFKSVVNNSPTKIHIKDVEGRYVLINSEAEKLFGMTNERARGKTSNEIFDNERAKEFKAHDRAVLDSGQTIEREEQWDLDGNVRTYLTVKFPIRDGESEIVAIGAIGTDITVRKEAEEALRESEARQRQAAELAKLGSWVRDPLREQCSYASEGMAKLVGLSLEEYLAHIAAPGGFVVFVHPDDRDRYLAEFQRLRNGERIDFEYRFINATGEVRYAREIAIPALDRDGRVIQESGTYQDITETKQAEEQLRQAQKMEAVGQLTAGVAHDFNNMLAVIWGNAELLEDELGDDHPQLAAVVRATQRGAELTQRLLAFSRKQVLNPENINANNLIADITGLLRRTLEEHIDIETVTAAGLWNCEVDPAQLENTLLNLAINARDAMPDGGKLTIETANTRLDDDYAAAQAEVKPGQYVMLAVTDTGSGIPMENRERVFEPFFTTKAVGAGSGLGLSMVYGFVKQSGGHVTIYSEQNEGTTIKLYLPRSTETAAVERKPATDAVPVARGETVLVVEDDPDLRTLAVALLSNLGYQVMEAGTAAAALEQLGSTTRVNLLLTDVMLPGGMNGRELAAEVERRAPGIPVLYMSGYTEDAIAHHGRLDAGAALLQKPFRRTDLARAVRRVLDSRSA